MAEGHERGWWGKRYVELKSDVLPSNFNFKSPMSERYDPDMISYDDD